MSPTDDEQIDALTAQVRAVDYDAQASAARLGARAAPALAALARDDDPEVVVLALVCLGISGGAPAVEAGLELLEAPDPQVSGQAVQLLQTHPPAGGEGRLLEVYRRTRDPWLEEALPRLAAGLGREARPALWLEALRDRVEPEVEEEDETPLPDLLEQASDGFVAGLARMGQPEARRVFAERLRSGREARDWLARAAEQEAWVLPVLVELLAREEPADHVYVRDQPRTIRVCDLAAWAIVQVTGGDPGFEVRRTRSYDEAQRAAIRALVE